jgi:hypothetical protein
MHTLNPFENRSTPYPVKALAILAKRGRLPTCHALSHVHMPDTNSPAIKGGDL